MEKWHWVKAEDGAQIRNMRIEQISMLKALQPVVLATNWIYMSKDEPGQNIDEI